jgi:hypothetical protein
MPAMLRIVYTLLGAGPIKLVGLVLLFTEETISEAMLAPGIREKFRP